MLSTFVGQQEMPPSLCRVLLQCRFVYLLTSSQLFIAVTHFQTCREVSTNECNTGRSYSCIFRREGNRKKEFSFGVIIVWICWPVASGCSYICCLLLSHQIQVCLHVPLEQYSSISHGNTAMYQQPSNQIPKNIQAKRLGVQIRLFLTQGASATKFNQNWSLSTSSKIALSKYAQMLFEYEKSVKLTSVELQALIFFVNTM